MPGPFPGGSAHPASRRCLPACRLSRRPARQCHLPRLRLPALMGKPPRRNPANALRHLDHTFTADGTIVLQSLRADAKKLFFYLIGIRSDAAEIIFRGTRNVGDAVTDQSAGAGLSKGLISCALNEEVLRFDFLKEDCSIWLLFLKIITGIGGR